MRPVFIALEALDGVGKTTLARALAARFGGVALNTPGDGLRAVSSAVLQGLGPHQDARCLFYAASVLARGVEARRLVEGGASVVMDRYWLSTISYGRARGVTARLSGVEALVPTPDLTVLLVVDEAERASRLRARGLTAADRETLDGTFRERVLHEMRSPDRRPGLRPGLEVDVTGLGPAATLEAVAKRIADFFC